MAMPTMRRDWTVEDLLDLPDDDGNRYEVLDGELLVTPAPTFPHQRAVQSLWRLLDDYLRTQPIGEAFGVAVDVVFTPRRAVQPDVLVLPFAAEGQRAQRFSDVGRLLLAAEVLSPSTAHADRVKKRRVYREEGVPEYWIVDLDARTVERSTPNDEHVEVLDAFIDWLPDGATAPLHIDIGAFFRAVLD
jgi:Uma2 family endonuclease